MAHGIEIYDAAGAVTLTITDRITRLHAQYSYTGILSGTQTTSVPGISATDGWFVHCDSFTHLPTIQNGSVLVVKAPYYFGSAPDSGVLYVFKV